MKQWTISRRIFVVTAFLIFICLLSNGINYFQFRDSLQDLTSLRVDAIPGTSLAGELAEHMEKSFVHILQARVASTPQEREEALKEYKELVAGHSADMKAYEKTITQMEDRINFEALKKLDTDFVTFCEQYVALVQSGKIEEAEQLLDGDLNEAYDGLSAQMEKLLLWNVQSGQEIVQHMSEDADRANRIILLVTVLAFGLGMTLSGISARSTKRALNLVLTRLNEASLQVATAAQMASSSGQNLAEGASEQAASLEESSATLEELTSMTSRNAENAERSNLLARDAFHSAENGAQEVRSMNEAMAEIKVASEGVAKIIKTIDDIAFQTNLLALNAAVEAARAGEAGAGFAVVADEVRNLAQRCTQAAMETTEKIEDAIVKTAHGVESSTRVATSFADIVEKTQEMETLIAEVATASKEQTTGIDQINASVSQIDAVTQTIAANAEETASAAEELDAQAEVLMTSVQDLTLLIGTSKKSQALAATMAEQLQKGARQALNCWDYMKCGRQAGGAKTSEFGVCPAYPDHGYACASVAGTFCGGTVQGGVSKKIGNCMKCSFFKSSHYDQKAKKKLCSVSSPSPRLQQPSSIFPEPAYANGNEEFLDF